MTPEATAAAGLSFAAFEPPVLIKMLPNGQPYGLPKRATSGAACYDLVAAIETPMRIHVSGHALVPCGFALQMRPDFEAQIRGRSGLALKHGILAHVGTIDSDYRGEVAALLFNVSANSFVIQPGDRIAQMAILQVGQCPLVETTGGLSVTARGDAGYGSTGMQGHN